MPAYGSGIFNTNASIWWVFYLVGGNQPGGSFYQWKLVLNKIKSSRKSIELTVVRAGEEEFYKYCEDPGYLRLNDAIVLTNRITNDVRGAFPELLLANMLTNMGCKPVRVGFRPRILKSVKGELDAVGIRCEGEVARQVIIFESKGQATVDRELQNEINHFSDTVTMVKQNLAAFCSELKLDHAEDVPIEATFVSMDTLEYVNNIIVPDNVKLWDFNRLVSELTRYGTPRKYLDLLRSVRVAVSL